MNNEGQASMEIILVTAFVIVTTLLIVVMWLNALGDTFVVSNFKLKAMEILDKSSSNYIIRKVEVLPGNNSNEIKLNVFIQPGGFQMRYPVLASEIISLDSELEATSKYSSVEISIDNPPSLYPQSLGIGSGQQGGQGSGGNGGQQQSQAQLTLSYPQTVSGAGQPFTVAFSINEIENLWAAQLRLNYDESIVSCSSFSRGAFFGSPGEIFDFFNSGTDFFEYVVVKKSDSNPVSGSGNIVTFNCTPNSSGTTQLLVNNYSFLNENGNSIQVSVPSSLPGINVS